MRTAEYPLVTFAKKAGKSTADINLMDMLRFLANKEPLPPKPKEAHMKKKTAKPAKKVNKRPRAVASDGGNVGHEDIVLGLRSCKDSPKDMLNYCKKTWGVSIPPTMLEGAPNPGVLRMRTANIVRGALTRAKRFRGEVYRVSRGGKK